MTGLLVGTFTVGGLHTLLWFPRALQMRTELTPRETRIAARLLRARARIPREYEHVSGAPGSAASK